MSTTGLVTATSSLGNSHCIKNHIAELANKHSLLVSPVAMVSQTNIIPTLQNLLQLYETLIQTVVITLDGYIVIHDIAHFLMQLVSILRTIHLANLVILSLNLLTSCFQLSIGQSHALLAFLAVLHSLRARYSTGICSRQQRVSTQTVCTVVLMVALTGSHQARNSGEMLSIYIDTAHGIMNGRENLHRNLTRILTYELSVDLDDTAQLALQIICRNMGQIQIYTTLVVDTQMHVIANLENSTGCNVTRNQVTICRVHFLQEVPRLAILVNPYTATLTTACLRHQTVLVGAWDSGRMNLNELRVTNSSALLIYSRYCRTITNSGSGATAKYLTRATSCQNNNISRESLNLHGVHALSYDTTADAILVLNDFDEFPELILGYAALNFPATNLLVQSIQQLLTSSGTSKAGTLILLTTEVTQVKNTLWSTSERYTHTIEHLNELWSSLNHALYSQLVSQEVTAIYGIIKMLINGVMLTLGVHAGIDTALSTEGVRTLYWAVREQVYFAASFTNFKGSHQTRKTATNYNNLIFSHVVSLLIQYF